MYLQTVLNLPMYLTDADFKTYWRYIDQYCKEIGVAITGGHTGSIEGQNSTISGGGTMISIAPKKEVLTSKQARAGDLIVMTRQCAMSSTAILAKSFPETVRQKAGNEIAQQAAALFYQTSVLPEALAVNALNKEKSRVHAMHDVTEGGVLGAVVEMAAAAGLGVEVLNDQINVSVVEKAVCSVFDLDPRFCIGSGSMILSVNPDEAETVLNTLRQMEIPACVIGEFTSDASKRTILENDAAYPVPYFETDPYWAAFFGALKRGWK
jgi:hydrogenase expression/formation protein HypE